MVEYEPVPGVRTGAGYRRFKSRTVTVLSTAALGALGFGLAALLTASAGVWLEAPYYFVSIGAVGWLAITMRLFSQREVLLAGVHGGASFALVFMITILTPYGYSLVPASLVAVSSTALTASAMVAGYYLGGWKWSLALAGHAVVASLAVGGLLLLVRLPFDLLEYMGLDVPGTLLALGILHTAVGASVGARLARFVTDATVDKRR